MATAPAPDVVARLSVVRDRIARAGGDPERVLVVAVTKGFGPEAVAAALAAGVADVGENYAAELLAKRADVAATTQAAGGPPGGVRWHFIGHVQRNKVRKLAGAVHLWEAVDRAAAGDEIARWAPGARVLVQVNVSGEAQKNGCAPGDAPELVERLRGIGLDVAGLMAIGPAGFPDDTRSAYRALAAMADRLGLAERSMGMTDDLETAVQEGSTMVRVGRALFGPRTLPTYLRQ